MRQSEFRQWLAIGLLAIAGCGASAPLQLASSGPEAADDGVQKAADQDVAAGRPPGAAEADAKFPRRIIFTAEIRLIAEDFNGIPTRVENLVDRYGGFIAHSQIRGRSGSPRDGTWKIRIPVKEYSAFVEAARMLGEVQNVSTDSQDVTAEFYDVEARIRNKDTEETRLLKHLTDSTGKIEEILAVEKELSRVREELERMQGRLRVLKDITALTTVTLHVDEIKGYLPTDSAGFLTRVSRAFYASLAALRATAEATLIAAVVVGPWLVAPAVAGGVFVFLVRRRRAS